MLLHFLMKISSNIFNYYHVNIISSKIGRVVIVDCIMKGLHSLRFLFGIMVILIIVEHVTVADGMMELNGDVR